MSSGGGNAAHPGAAGYDVHEAPTRTRGAGISGAPATASPLAQSGLLERGPAALRRDAPLRQAADILVESGAWGVPVVDEGGLYLGLCTTRSILARCLPVSPSTLAPGAGLGYLRHDVSRLRERLCWEADRPVGELLDLGVPAVRESTSVPQLLLILDRRTPMVPIVSDAGRHLLGVATWERALRAIWQPS